MNPFKARFSAWFCAIGWAVFIFIISSVSKPVPDMPNLQKYHADLAFHGVEYGLLAVLWYRAVRLSFAQVSAKNSLFFVLLFCAVYAASDEFHQSFVPNRTMSLLDWTADVAGSGIVLYLISKRRFEINASD